MTIMIDEIPKCSCHGVEMRQDRGWYCIIKKRERQRRWKQTEKGKENIRKDNAKAYIRKRRWQLIRLQAKYREMLEELHGNQE